MRPIRYLTMSAFAFGLSYLWNALGPIVLPQLVGRVVPENLVGSGLGGIRFLGLGIAIIVQPLFGHISDHARTRYGKRKPFIAIGTLGDLIFLAGLLWAPDYAWLVVAYFGLQVVSNVAHGAYQGYIPDLVPEEKAGTASGAKNLAEMIALIVASIAVSSLFGAGLWALGIASIGAVLAICTLITWLWVDENASVAATQSPDAPPARDAATRRKEEAVSLKDVFALDFRRDRPFLWWLLSRFLVLTGVYFLQTFAFIFFKNELKALDPNLMVGTLLAVNGVLIALTVQPAGLIADKVGSKPMVLIAGLLNATGVFLMIFARGRVFATIGPVDVTDVMLFGTFIGVGMGIFLVTSWSLGIKLTPGGAGGKYLGISNLATAGAGAAASIGGPIIDFWGYTPMFLCGTAIILIGTALLFKIREPVAAPRPAAPSAAAAVA
jgi:Na+/melibiose symporter-like transporter